MIEWDSFLNTMKRILVTESLNSGEAKGKQRLVIGLRMNIILHSGRQQKMLKKFAKSATAFQDYCI
jgi:hypothetical protein